MPDDRSDWDDYATQAARAAGLVLPDEIRPQVLVHFAILADHAARIMALELADEVEPAPVFRP